MVELELDGKLREQRPDLPVILATGFSERIVTSGSGGLPVIYKPYRLETLAEALDKAMRPDAEPDSSVDGRAESCGRGAISSRRHRQSAAGRRPPRRTSRSEEHTSELQSLMRISYAVFCLQKKNQN